jgi:hypothetical protein
VALVGDETSKARTAFMVAAAWPDIIRIDPRFYDDIAGDVQPTRLLPGFPDMKSSSDRTKQEAIETPNAHTELLRLIAKVGGSVTGANPVYDLPWLVHIASDVHNPVHCAHGFRKRCRKVILSGRGCLPHKVGLGKYEILADLGKEAWAKSGGSARSSFIVTSP